MNTDNHDHGEKITHCQPNWKIFNGEQCKKAVQEKLKLRSLVHQLAQGREDEETTTAWRSYVQRLKVEHAIIYKKSKKFDEARHTPNVALIDYYTTPYNPNSGNRSNWVINDIRKSNSLNKSSGTLSVDNNRYFNTVLKTNADRHIQPFGPSQGIKRGHIPISVFYPVSTQAFILKRTGPSSNYFMKRRYNDTCLDCRDGFSLPEYDKVKHYLKNAKGTETETQADTHTHATQTDKLEMHMKQSYFLHDLTEELNSIRYAINTTTKVTSCNQDVLELINEKLIFLVHVAHSLVNVATTSLTNVQDKETHESNSIVNARLDEQNGGVDRTDELASSFSILRDSKNSETQRQKYKKNSLSYDCKEKHRRQKLFSTNTTNEMPIDYSDKKRKVRFDNVLKFITSNKCKEKIVPDIDIYLDNSNKDNANIKQYDFPNEIQEKILKKIKKEINHHFIKEEELKIRDNRKQQLNEYIKKYSDNTNSYKNTDESKPFINSKIVDGTIKTFESSETVTSDLHKTLIKKYELNTKEKGSATIIKDNKENMSESAPIIDKKMSYRSLGAYRLSYLNTLSLYEKRYRHYPVDDSVVRKWPGKILKKFKISKFTENEDQSGRSINRNRNNKVNSSEIKEKPPPSEDKNLIPDCLRDIIEKSDGIEISDSQKEVLKTSFLFKRFRTVKKNYKTGEKFRFVIINGSLRTSKWYIF